MSELQKQKTTIENITPEKLEKRVKQQASLFLIKALVGKGFGYIIGRAAQKITKTFYFYTGLTFGLIGALNWMNWITINWTEIDEDLHIVHNEKPNDGVFKRIFRFVTRTVPLMGGFAAGFRLAFVWHPDQI